MKHKHTHTHTDTYTHIYYTHDGGELQTSDTTKHVTNPVRAMEGNLHTKLQQLLQDTALCSLRWTKKSYTLLEGMACLGNINIRTKTEAQLFTQLDVLSILHFHLTYFTIRPALETCSRQAHQHRAVVDVDSNTLITSHM